MRERPVDKTRTPLPEPPTKTEIFWGGVGEVVFLFIVTVATYMLYNLTATSGGRYAMIGSEGLDPLLGKAGIYLPFLLWGIYIVLHKGWLKMALALTALFGMTFVLLMGVSHYYYKAPWGKVVYAAYVLAPYGTKAPQAVGGAR